MVSNLGQIFPAAAAGFTVRADIGMNACNSYALRVLKELKAASVTLPPELSFDDMRMLAKCLPVEAVLYGRVPVMHTEACLIKAASGVCSCTGVKQLRDRRAVFPLTRCYECRSTLYSPEKLFLAPQRREYERLGLWCIRLDFTTENADECVRLMQRFLGQNRYEPSARTRGLYV
jgi:putative protease